MVEAIILDGLNEAERRELLALLEERDFRLAQWPPDEREPLSALADRAVREVAERCADPAAFLAAQERHDVSRDAHFKRLWAERRVDVTGDISTRIQSHVAAWRKAGKLATADGFPDPCARAVRETPAEPPEEADQTVAGLDHVYAEPEPTGRSAARISAPAPSPAPDAPRRPWFAGSGRSDPHSYEDGI